MLTLALVGCPRMMQQPTVSGDSPGVEVTAVGEATPGDGVSVTAGAMTSASGCRFAYRVYRSSAAADPVEVVLAHGFLRSQARMSVLARRLATAGIATATLDLCNMRPWDGAHRANAADMTRLARAVGAERVVYAGFSAGGLAALLAGSADPSAAGVFALDLVDRDGIGVAAARSLRVPLHGLFGAPSSCNAYGNGRAAFLAAERARQASIVEATHCDFEAPTDWLCRALCESDGHGSRHGDDIRGAIVERSAAAIGDLLADDWAR
jgi:pimeloyl-ACP methyl ester carboxylesterase